MSRLARDGTVEPVSRGQILRRERGQGTIHFSCSADHVQDWHPFPVDPYSCYICDHTLCIIRPGRHTQLANYCMCPLFCLLIFCFFGHVALSDYHIMYHCIIIAVFFCTAYCMEI